MTIDKDNIAEYLNARHLFPVPLGTEYTVEALGGGFLNTVLRVQTGEHALVVKQALDTLRLFPDLKVTTDRIVFERKALEVLNRFFPNGTVPPVIHFDDDNRVLVMGDLGKKPSVEQSLIEGRVNPETAERLGTFLAEVHRRTFDDSVLRAEFDNEGMQSLRLQYCFYFLSDPALLDAAGRLGQRFTHEKRVLLHGDFWTASVMADDTRIHVFDLEFAYYGHPSQDIGFMMAHYLLHARNTPHLAGEVVTAVRRLWTAYAQGMAHRLPADAERAALQQAGVEMLFRIDGINRVKYVTDDAAKARIRAFASRLILDDQMTVERMCALGSSAS